MRQIQQPTIRCGALSLVAAAVALALGPAAAAQSQEDPARPDPSQQYDEQRDAARQADDLYSEQDDALGAIVRKDRQGAASEQDAGQDQQRETAAGDSARQQQLDADERQAGDVRRKTAREERQREDARSDRQRDDGARNFPGGSPYAMDDRSWIEIGGTVESVSRDSFELDYGDGVITVEMDDGDRDADGYQLLRGDEVSVSGMIDDDFFMATSIEASSVYVEDIGTTFYSSAIDDEDAATLALNDVSPVDVSAMVVRGFVTDVNTTSFVLDTGPRTLEINVAELGYDPLDEEGYQQIEVGDYVKASGEISRDLFSGRELVADSVTELFLNMEQPVAVTPGS